MQIPLCIEHRSAMYRRGEGAPWSCFRCEQPPSAAQIKAQKILALWPLDARPHCRRCKARMTIHKALSQNPRWSCNPCEVKAPVTQTPRTPHKHIDVGVRPYCLECKVECGVGGTPGRRRWTCGRCGFSILAVGKGYRKRQELSLTEDTEQEQIAILALIEDGYCEPEEIADDLPTIPLDRIKALCVALVNASQHSRYGYEWRKVGRKPLRGQSRLGIFRKDAPALVRSIFQRNDRRRPDMYAVDRAGITEARIAG